MCFPKIFLSAYLLEFANSVKDFISFVLTLLASVVMNVERSNVVGFVT